MDIKIKLDDGYMPCRKTDGAAAYDLFAPNDITISKGRQVINLKFSLEMPPNIASLIQSRSGFSVKGFAGQIFKGGETKMFDADVITGLIDSDYRGHVGVIVQSRESSSFIVPKGTRIAQMLFVEIPQIKICEVNSLSNSERGAGGFGSTGVK